MQQDEYDFMCDKLGRGAEIMRQALEQHLKEPSKLKKFHHTATPSIQEMLLNSPPAQGMLMLEFMLFHGIFLSCYK